MGRISNIKKSTFEKLLEDGYGSMAIASYFGVSTHTLNTYVKQHYDNKTFKQLYLERRATHGSTEN